MEATLNRVVDYLQARSWQIAVLVVIVAAISWALRHRSAHVRYLLWLVVLAKCLVPPVVSVPVPVPVLQESESLPPVIAFAPSPREGLTARAPQEAQPMPTPVTRSTAPMRLRLTTRQWLALIWLGGASVFAMVAAIKAVRTALWLRRQRHRMPHDWQADIDGLLSSLGLKRLPRMWLIEGIGQPFVWGLVRGDIYLPLSFLRVRQNEHRKSILGHELSHVLRFDAAVNALQIIAQTIFWFHPLVWWANKRIRAEREKSCDEVAIARLGTQPKEYSTAIVNALIQEQESTHPVPSLAIAGPTKSIEERIRTMLRPGRRFYRRPSLSAAVLVLVAGLFAVPTAVVLTAQARTGDNDVNNVLAPYEAARDASSHRYLMVIKNEQGLSVTYQDGPRLYRATYAFSGPPHAGRIIDLETVARERDKAGDTVPSMLAWAESQTPQNVDVYDGTEGCSLFADGYGHLKSTRKRRRPPDMLQFTSLPTLQSLAWPEFRTLQSTCRIVSDDPCAIDNRLLCIEERHTVTSSRDGEVAEITRFYLNPDKGYICQRRHEARHDYAVEVTQYDQTTDGQWHPLKTSEFGYRYSMQPMTDTPTAVNAVYLDTNPTFPKGVFSSNALLERYAALVVSELATQPPVPGREPNASQRRVAGRVLAGETQKPIANALVRVAVPAADMRFVRVSSKQITQEDGTKSDIYETRTNPNGWFEILVPVEEGKDTISIDALAPGYGTAAGTFRSGGNDPSLTRMSLAESMAGVISNLTIHLPQAIHVAGIVTDDTGVLQPGVSVSGQMVFDRGSGGIASTKTDANGKFEIFDFPLSKRPGETAKLIFTSPTAEPVTLSGLYDMSDEEHASLEVTLPRGLKIAGVLLDADGQPAPGVLVEAVNGIPLKDTTTDSKGRFELAGLKRGPVTVRAHALDIDQKATSPWVSLINRDVQLTLKMERIEFKNPLHPVTLWGMQLVDVTPELRKVYDLDPIDTILILDPGPDYRRLDIGELRKGYCFWIIEEQKVSDIREMVAELLKQLTPPWPDRPGDPSAVPRRVRVVYTTRTGTNTQYLTLIRQDVEELRQLAQKLGIAAPDDTR